MKVKVGINGFGRIGRQSLKAMLENYPDVIEVVAINDLMTPEVNAHLLKYDSNYGGFPGSVEVDGSNLVVNGKKIQVLAERNPENLPWSKLGVEIVLESTGLFTNGPDAAKHIQAGAKKVLISAPAKQEDITIVLGVNEDKYDPAKHNIVSNASCTTNCLAPVAKVIHEHLRIVKGLMTTIHSYTNDQRILDLPHKDLRRARAAALNMIPTTTGAAKALALVIPELKGKFDGLSVRVPTPTVSLVDFVAEVEKPTTADEVNMMLKAASEVGPMVGILGYCAEPLVSMDFRGDPRSSIVDAGSTFVVEGNLVKVLSWYDNEWGYSSRVADLINYIAKKGL